MFCLAVSVALLHTTLANQRCPWKPQWLSLKNKSVSVLIPKAALYMLAMLVLSLLSHFECVLHAEVGQAHVDRFCPLP